jgi:sugar phosphate isomerase/epimerase
MKKYELAFYVDVAPEALRKKIEILKSFGIERIGTDGFMQWRDDAFTHQIAAIIADTGMSLQSFHAPFGIAFSDEKDLSRSLADNRRIIDVAASWGAKNIVWHARTLRSYEGDTHFARFAEMEALGTERLDKLTSMVVPETCAYAAEHGINVNLTIRNWRAFEELASCLPV